MRKKDVVTVRGQPTIAPQKYLANVAQNVALRCQNAEGDSVGATNADVPKS